MKPKIVKISLYYPPFNSFRNIVIITDKGIFDPRQALSCFISVCKILVRPFLKQEKAPCAGWAAFGGEQPSWVIKEHFLGFMVCLFKHSHRKVFFTTVWFAQGLPGYFPLNPHPLKQPNESASGGICGFSSR